MRIYTIFDDFGSTPVDVLKGAGIQIDVHPKQKPRPNDDEMKLILESYDGVIIGTSQKIKEDMFDNINKHRIIATASVGTDHISIPNNKKDLVTIINTPNANSQSVAEYTMGCALSCCKRFDEAKKLYNKGLNNKNLYKKPEDLAGKKLGVVGAGNISREIMKYGRMLGLNVSFWTAHPENHYDIIEGGFHYIQLDDLLKESDVISVNLPNNAGTYRMISEDRVKVMKNNAIFISVSRIDTIDVEALILKARENPAFYVCLDIDIDHNVTKQDISLNNIMITPHIAGGTIETRKRMFLEAAEQIVKLMEA